MPEYTLTIGLLGILCAGIAIGVFIPGFQREKTTTPTIIIENTEQCQINCSQCIQYCNTIIDETLQTYIKMRGVGQTIAIREGYT